MMVVTVKLFLFVRDKMDESLRISMGECINVLSDKEWHEAYELHARYNLSALEIFNTLKILLKLGLLEKVGTKIRLVPLLTNYHMTLMNRLQKTKRPQKLDLYVPRYLTRRKNSV